MTVYVDEIREFPIEAIATPARRLGRRWCHLTADTPEELHEFADRLGLKRSWFQDHPKLWHYDLTPGMRARALIYGARQVATKELIRIAALGMTGRGVGGTV